MNELIKQVEEWSKNKGLDGAESSKQFLKVVDGFPNHIITTGGEVVKLSYIDEAGRRRPTRVLTQRVSNDGYLTVKLNHEGVSLTKTVHRLVAEAFIPNPDNKPTVNHIDGNKLNNHVDNLEWATMGEQMTHAYSMGLKNTGVVNKIMTKKINSKPVRCQNLETDEVRYYLSARDCSTALGYSKRWCDNIINNASGYTQQYYVDYTTFEEVTKNTDKVDLATLVKLVEYWSVDKGLNKTDSTKQMLKTVEEIGEVASALARGQRDELRDGIGDVIVTLIILAQQNDMNIHECLNTAYDEIKGRTGKMVDGVFVKSEDLAEISQVTLDASSINVTELTNTKVKGFFEANPPKFMNDIKQ